MQLSELGGNCPHVFYPAGRPLKTGPLHYSLLHSTCWLRQCKLRCLNTDRCCIRRIHAGIFRRGSQGSRSSWMSSPHPHKSLHSGKENSRTHQCWSATTKRSSVRTETVNKSKNIQKQQERMELVQTSGSQTRGKLPQGVICDSLGDNAEATLQCYSALWAITAKYWGNKT